MTPSVVPDILDIHDINNLTLEDPDILTIRDHMIIKDENYNNDDEKEHPLRRPRLPAVKLFEQKPNGKYLRICAPMVRYSKLPFRDLVRK